LSVGCGLSEKEPIFCFFIKKLFKKQALQKKSYFYKKTVMRIIIILCFGWTFSFPLLAQPNIVATTPTDSICIGESVVLAVEGDIADSYTWSPASWIDDVNSPNPTVTPGMTVTYMVEGVFLENNLIVNGDFEQGNTGFTTEYDMPTSSTSQWGLLGDNATAAISTSPSEVHNNFCIGSDHTSGSGNMMIFNGMEPIE
jgi:hypothetical protein